MDSVDFPADTFHIIWKKKRMFMQFKKTTEFLCVSFLVRLVQSCCGSSRLPRIINLTVGQ